MTEIQPKTPTIPPPIEPPVATPESEGHEGATDEAVGDRTGPGAGFDNEPKKIKDKGGVAPS